MLCPALVGREEEVAELRRRLSDVAVGGGLAVAVGEPGAGKSRLLDEAARVAVGQGLMVLRGRAVPSESPVPYRPIAEALLAAFRHEAPPSDPSLVGFHPQLARLVPPWGDGGAVVAGDSPLLVGEAIVRLLLVAAPDTGAVILLEDIHWADPETIAILEHLVDAARGERVLCICSTRPGGASGGLIDRLARRDPASRLTVGPLANPDVERMVAACLAPGDAPAALVPFVCAHSDGNPFLVEELLAGLVASGDLRLEGNRWEVSELRAAVPASLRASIQHRLDELEPTTRRVIGAAALLGREFSWELLPGIADVDGRSAVDALRSAVSEQIIESAGNQFMFRHALTREAVLSAMLPPERQELAQRAWPAVELANPGLPGGFCELAADLAEAAGDLPAAGSRLVESARRALASGAIATAEATARRARRLSAADPERLHDADETLVEVLVAAGKPTEALALGADLGFRLVSAGAPPERRLRAHLLVGRAAVAAGDLRTAAEAVEQARQVEMDPVPAGPDVLAAHVALDGGDLDAARALAERGLATAEAADDFALQCDALIVLGRTSRDQRGEEGIAIFERAAELAESAGLGAWHLKARQEQSICVWLKDDASVLHETRALATTYGAVATAAVIDLTLADVALSSFDREGCLQAATACTEASRRYHLATEAVAELWLAAAHALAGDDAAMQLAVDAALAPDPDDARILGDLYGRVLATRAIVRDELDTLPELMERMAHHVRSAPQGTSVFPGRILRALIHTVDGSDAAASARAEVTAMADQYRIPMIAGAARMVEAVEQGRLGRADVAGAEFEAAWSSLERVQIGRGQMFSYVPIMARAAHRDGWGAPVRWLRAAEAFFAGGGYERTARRCRIVLGEIGAPMPRRGRGESTVPEALRSVGVTSREVDVLKLVVEGRTNKEIADALVLSPKTVERHLSNLFGRFYVSRRADLVQATREHLKAEDR